jgi:hypothetical protein
MDKEEHIKTHKELHKALDKLCADFIVHTGKFPTETNLMEFMKWSFKQTTEPEGV